MRLDERYVIGNHCNTFGIWINYYGYRGVVSFGECDTFVYVSNNCIKYQWCWGGVESKNYQQAMKVLE